MDHHAEAVRRLVPGGFTGQSLDCLNQYSRRIRALLEGGQLPENGLSDFEVECLLLEVAQLDSNNFPGNAACGEREARVYSSLVRRRHFGMAHGVGRSGDLSEAQPKAVGSSLFYRVTDRLASDALRLAGMHRAVLREVTVLPMATGMTLAVCMMALKQDRPEGADLVLFTRVDQKSCFKSIAVAGCRALVVENRLDGDEVATDLAALEAAMLAEPGGASRVRCVMSNTSAFAPRVPDRVDEIAKLCARHGVPHVINNAFGVQSSKAVEAINEAFRVGRVDAVVQSTDKNFLVPVGGAVVAGPLVPQVCKMYPGRASMAPIMDLGITLLSMGKSGYLGLLADRKQLHKELLGRVTELAQRHGCRVLATSKNKVSIVIALDPLLEGRAGASSLGAKLFTKCVSGARVVTGVDEKVIDKHRFKGYGAHTDSYPVPYLTVSCAIGMTRSDADLLLQRLEKTLAELKS
jgi:O-phospho-L-seryl-tRNASec:L-selenocysteinyl-tRNA synthase